MSTLWPSDSADQAGGPLDLLLLSLPALKVGGQNQNTWMNRDDCHH
jgi:hypothetical protein